MKKLAILSSLLLLALNSCSNEDIINEELPDNFEKRISVVAEDLVPANGTRTSYTDNGNGYSFAWSEGDALGIFPTSGHQTDFPIGADGVGSNTAVFDGGKWALRPNESYAAYYPLIHNFDLNLDAIPVDYTGQIQNGNGNTAHLSAYDFMASNYTEVDAKGNVNFKLQHLGCLVQFVLNMPEEDTYSSMEIVSDKTPFITSGEYSLSDNSHVLTKVQESQEITIGLNEVSTTSDNKTLTITAMFAPVDLSESRLTLTIKGSSKDYTIIMYGQNLQTGKAVAVGEINDTTPYVTFSADETQTLTMSKEVKNLEYSVNNGLWTELGSTTVTFGGSNGDLRLRGSNGYGTGTAAASNSPNVIFGTEASVECSGDIRTLADYANYLTEDTSDDLFCNLFNGCSALISTPELPANKLASNCYAGMFFHCTSLTNAPKLPAMKLAKGCYDAMFYECWSLTSAPALPALTLAEGCYASMFFGCFSLINAPDLPAEEMTESCYCRMFGCCNSLTTAPELPALTLAKLCYYGMFDSCTQLNYIKVMATDMSAPNCLDWWLHNVSSTGIFVKNASARWNENDTSVFPRRWCVVSCDKKGYEYVDLGLSVKWATCNLGATKPEEFGDYYAWGETKPKCSYIDDNGTSMAADGTVAMYNWSTYKYAQETYDKTPIVDYPYSPSDDYTNYYQLSKYVPSIWSTQDWDTGSHQVIEQNPDNKYRLDFSDDAAYANRGNGWRMPTKDEAYELEYECTSTLTTINGVEGYKISSNVEGYENNFIFLPFAGEIVVTGKNSYDHYDSNYWTSDLHPIVASRAEVFIGGDDRCHGEKRFVGLPIRPVTK